MKKLPLLLLMLNTFTVLLGVGLIIPVLPAYLEYFNASGTTAGLLVAAFGFTQFLFSPLGGKWSDRFGRRPLILCGLILNATSHLMFAVADHISLLFISRLIGGIGLGFTIPSIMAYVADITDREQRGKGMGWIGASVSLGIAIGPGIGGFLADVSIRTPYYSAALLTVVAAFSIIWLPETRNVQTIVKPVSDAPLITDNHWLGSFLRTVKSGFFVLLMLNLIMSFGLMSFETVFPLLASDLYAFTTKEIAAIITGGAMMGVIAQSLLLTKLITRYGEYRLINASLLLAAITLILLLVWGNFGYILIVSMLFFTFQSLLRPAISTLLSKRASDDEQGYIAGLGNTYMSLGNIFGPIAAGMLYDVRQTFPYLFGSIVLLLGLWIYVAFEGKKSNDAKQVSQVKKM